jgi:hypothetical protein
MLATAGLATAGLAAAVLPWIGMRSFAADEERLRRAVPQAARASALGRAYLARAPGEADPVRLAAAIIAGLGAPVDDERLPALIRARVRADFAAGDIVTIDGWVLSRTEARLAALWA